MTEARAARSKELVPLPGWAWPLVGLVAGSLLVIVVHGTCFVDPNC